MRGMTTAEATKAMQALARAANGAPGPRSVSALRADYVSGRIELDEFEARVEAAMIREDAARAEAVRWHCERDGHLFIFGDPLCRQCGEPYGAAG